MDYDGYTDLSFMVSYMLLNEPTGVHTRKGPPRPQDAIAPFLAAAGSFEMTGEDEIGDALTLLAEHGDAISMYASGSREPILGRILSVDPEQPHFVMELNEGAALPPGKITFVMVLRNAKMQFRLGKPEWNTLPGQPHLIPMDFPETCTVLNRRAHERVEAPLGANFSATFVLNGIPHEVAVYDLSLGGIGLRGAKTDVKGLLKGRKLLEVQLELGEDNVYVADLEVRFTCAYRSFLMGEQVHVGCKFINLPADLEREIKSIVEQILQSAK